MSKTKEILNREFPDIVKELQKISGQVILDGELVVIDSNGNSHAELLEKYLKNGKGTPLYYVFDMVFKNGKSLRQLPLINRKDILKEFLKVLSLPLIRFSDHVVEKGIAFCNAAAKNDVEAIIGKKMKSSYISRKSRNWAKITCDE